MDKPFINGAFDSPIFLLLDISLTNSSSATSFFMLSERLEVLSLNATEVKAYGVSYG